MTVVHELPQQSADVVIVGAGLAGLSAARELERLGVDDVVLLEARERVGGRMKKFVRPNGRILMEGAEFIGDYAVNLLGLASEMGIKPVPIWSEGQSVRYFDGTRHLEDAVLGDDPEAAEALQAAVTMLVELAQQVSPEEPWSAPLAAEWDQTSMSDWLDEHLPSPAARQIFENQFSLDMPQTPILVFLWRIAKRGAVLGLSSFDMRLEGGTFQIPARLADEVSGRVHLSVPVRRIEHESDGATLFYEGGSIRARAVVMAIEPGQVSGIEFEPFLPADRVLLQDRWVCSHDLKWFAIYDRPFWREAGLSGSVIGLPPVHHVKDLSPAAADEGILEGVIPVSPSLFGRHPEIDWADVLGDPEKTREAIITGLTVYFGDEARHPKEFYAFSWLGDRWSQGCGATHLVRGALTTVGKSLLRRVNTISWAGADVYDQVMEGAIRSGQRAAQEVAESLKLAQHSR